MAVRERWLDRIAQPQEAARVDWSNPINEGLGCLFYGQLPEAVSGREPSVVSGSLDVGEAGSAFSINGGSGDERLAYAVEQLPSAGAPITLEFLVWLSSAPELSAIGGICPEATFTTTGGNGQRRALIAYPGSPGNIYWWGNSNDWDSGIDFPTGALRHVLVSKGPGTSGATITLYVDGIEVAQGSNGGTLVLPSSGPFFVIGSRHVIGTQITGKIFKAAYYVAEKTAQEAALLASRPWANFAERICVPVSAGAPTAALEGAATGSASATGALTTAITVASAAVVTGTAAGSLSTAIQVAGAAQASGQAAGALTTGIPLDGVAVTATLAAGDLTAQIRLDGAALAAALASGSLDTGTQLAGDATGAGQASGGLTTVIVLRGDAVGAALAAADLTAPGSGLAGAAVGGAVAAGALTTQIPLAGGAQASVIAAGSLSTSISMAGAAVGVVSATGDLVIALSLSGDAVAAALAGASLSTSITMRGAAVAGAQAAGQLLDPVPVYAEFGVRKALTRVQQYGRRAQMQSSRRRN